MTKRTALYGCHQAAFLDADNLSPLAITDLVTAVSVVNGGDLVAREGGSYRFPLEYFEGRNTVEIQVTLKKWAPEFYRIAAGARTIEESNFKTANIVETVESKGGGTGLEFDFNDTSNGVPVFGYYLARFKETSGSDHKFDFFMVGSPQGAELEDGQEFAFKLDETISTSASDIGNGLTAKLGASYTPSEGDSLLVRVHPAEPGALRASYSSIGDRDRRPYVSGIFSAESTEGILFQIHIPKMKCSSGIPFTMNEKTDNEYQLTFMACLPDERNLDIINIRHTA